MELTTGASTAFVTAIFLMVAAAFPAALSHSAGDGSGPASAPSRALSPSNGINSLCSDGTTIDQGIAYVLMLVALILTYLIH